MTIPQYTKEQILEAMNDPKYKDCVSDIFAVESDILFRDSIDNLNKLSIYPFNILNMSYAIVNYLAQKPENLEEFEG